jgi:predicted small secreted protein
MDLAELKSVQRYPTFAIQGAPVVAQLTTALRRRPVVWSLLAAMLLLTSCSTNTSSGFQYWR